MRTACLALICMLLTACGGGDNSADAVPAEEKYIPDYSTAVGATEAFIRAVQTENSGLLSLTLLDDERDRVLPAFEANFQKSRKLGLKWKIEQIENEWVPEKEARSLLKFNEMKDGEPTGEWTGNWYVFVKSADGTWKYSDAASKRWRAHILEQQQPPSNNAPGD